MENIFKSECKIPMVTILNVPKEVIERQFIMNFFNDIPIESLKKLINFQEIDFNNKNLCGDSREDKHLYELLCQLQFEDSLLLRCRINLDKP